MCMLLSVNFFGVAVCPTSMINWRGYICPKYMCIVLYVKHIWGSGIPQIYESIGGEKPLVYVHSADM